jgi:hypothetical protein
MSNRQLEDGNRIAQGRINQPSIISVIGQRVELRRAGREYKGLCPFHSENTPSFTVNEDKGVFYCHGCHIGGDVIRFVELTDGTDFKGALEILEIQGNGYKPKPRDVLKNRGAVIVAQWMNEQQARVGAILRELSRDITIAEKAGASTLIEYWDEEFSILATLFDDLQEPQYAGELYAVRDAIEAITTEAPIEPLMEFPPWTPEYAAYLTAHSPEQTW